MQFQGRTLPITLSGILCLGLLAEGTACAKHPAELPAALSLPAKPADDKAPQWEPYQSGFEKDEVVKRSGAFGLRCVNKDALEVRGGRQVFTLNQEKPVPVVVDGWSKAEGVTGAPNSDYSLYIDLEYTDGSNVWAYASAFETGTHDWQRRQIVITPEKPIKSLFVYGVLRGHTGTAWFDDFSVKAMTGNGVFDSQTLTPPTLPSGAKSGWFVRDVAEGGAIFPLVPGGKAIDGLSLTAEKQALNGRIMTTTLSSNAKKTRSLTLYYVERFEARQPVWWNTIREKSVLTDTEGSNAVTSGNAGATGTQTKYPFGCVTGSGAGRALALPPNAGPYITRIGFHPGSQLLYMAFDLALMPERDPAKVTVARYDVSPEWGMRDAARVYYTLAPAYYEKRAKGEGIWLPFTDPAQIKDVADYGILWHEGDNSVASDDKKGILSFRYTEPMSFWMPMPVAMKRDYETAYAYLKRLASGEEKIEIRNKTNPIDLKRQKEAQYQAKATLTSGSMAPNGMLNVQFQNAPWCNGAVWTLNPNPRLPGEWTTTRVDYDVADADKRYGKGANGILDGEYLDSMENWAATLDYGPTALRVSRATPTFSADPYRAAIPTWFSVWEYTDWLRTDLHKRGKLLMGNSTPWSIYALSALLDAAGTETGWLGNDGSFQPESDGFMSWRRTLVGRKPYLILLNTDFDKFTNEYVKKYFERCVFYGIFPSFYSVNAADKPYWENPKWYERDRALFRKYIPIVKRLSAAGWEPVTLARSDRPEIYVERFGKEYITLLNAGSTPTEATITLDLDALGKPNKRFIQELFTDKALTVTLAPSGKTATVTVKLQRDEARVLHLTEH